MTERTKQKLIRELKLWVPMVSRYAELNGFENFDFFYNGNEQFWECHFFDGIDSTAESYVSKTPEGIIKQLIKHQE